jgi:GNAT superfamily N-acetyltransferase
MCGFSLGLAAKYSMIIEDIVSRSIVDEYGITGSYDPMQHIRAGARLKNSLPVVKTPLSDFEVRYKKDGDYHDYFLYNSAGQTVGLFTIEDTWDTLKVLRPGIRAVTPHMALAPSAQRQGISTQAYTTFLRGGPWVFATDEHTQGAARLWDSIATGDIVSFYVGQQGQLVKGPSSSATRVMGPKSRFKL